MKKSLLLFFLFFICLNVFSDGDERYIQKTIWRIQNDASIFTESFVSKINTSKISAEKDQFNSSSNTITEIVDKNGRELQFDVAKYGEKFWFTVWLDSPVPSKSRIEYTIFGKIDKYVYFRNDLWVYEKRHYPRLECLYEEAVVLPVGAKLKSVEPEASEKTEKDGSVILIFKEELKEKEPFEVRVKYTL